MATFLLPDVLFNNALVPFEVFAANNGTEIASTISPAYFIITPKN
jgi:hypothetical protein